MRFMLVLMLLTNWVSGGHLQMLLAMFIDGKSDTQSDTQLVNNISTNINLIGLTPGQQ